MSWDDKIAFVTGASQGIGRACALLLAEAGARVVVASRNLDKLQSLAGEINKENEPVRALPLALDVSREDSIKEAFQKAVEQFGKIDILVNNAGIARDGLVMRMKRQAWDEVLETNLTAAYHCIQQVLPGMLRRRQGRIINITSVVAQMGNAGQANYVASKAGLIGLTRAVAQEVASRKITVNAVAPGFIETAMTDAINPEVRDKLLSRIPLGRLGQGLDVAHAVKFLASDEAAYITGHVLNVNGGMYL
ncbi:MAG: 3-oxoacyl-[acyl-carrier-protein] reductase [Acidobacteria bacterium]|nr:3-oxoacyl-[acyl-carrier-protein] reductase [Acidobacteriota bacterium]MCH8267612.1 3-oxoacyl-[acyl-carrier-protein] reductase [Acidobacteriota bacterium]MCZ6750584.1 3-oxoacyl-[acyl-carrier-protein] reductase [Acidobacteriota bacterium]